MDYTEELPCNQKTRTFIWGTLLKTLQDLIGDDNLATFSFTVENCAEFFGREIR